VEGHKIVSDELVGLKRCGVAEGLLEIMRWIVAWVEVDGKERLTTFLTNHLTWSAESVVELYRWRIEVLFRQLKQTLQLADFLCTRANAVRWQVWTALFNGPWPNHFKNFRAFGKTKDQARILPVMGCIEKKFIILSHTRLVFRHTIN
jgi:hypothetical protein